MQKTSSKYTRRVWTITLIALIIQVFAIILLLAEYIDLIKTFELVIVTLLLVSTVLFMGLTYVLLHGIKALFE